MSIPTDQHITYQLQYRKCGKASCSTCRTGQGHGKYWYAYWHEGSRLRSRYIGKELPEDVAARRLQQSPEELWRRQLTEESYRQVVAMIEVKFLTITDDGVALK